MDQQSTLDMNVGDSMPPRSMSLPSEGIEEIETLNNLVILGIQTFGENEASFLVLDTTVDCSQFM